MCCADWAKSMRPDFSHNPLISDCCRAQLPVTAFHKSVIFCNLQSVAEDSSFFIPTKTQWSTQRSISTSHVISANRKKLDFFFFNLTPIKRSYKNNELQQACTANLKGWLLTQTSMLSIYPIRTLSKLLESLKISVFLTVICASKMILLCQIKMTAKIERHQ